MPFFSHHSAWDELVEAATPAQIPENDAAVMAKFLPVADKINAYAPGSKAKSNSCSDCIRATWKRVKSAEPLIGLHAISLLDFLLKNCGVQFLGAFDDRDFVLKMRDFVKSKLEDNNNNNPKAVNQRQVAEALKARIQEWAEGEMKHISWIPVGPFEERKKERSNVRGLYNVLRRQGYSFPLLRPPPSTDPTKESEFERKEREELDMAIQASLNESNKKQDQLQLHKKIYPTSILKSTSSSPPPAYSALPSSQQQQQQQQQPQQQQQLRLVRALYDFEAAEADELTLRCGDAVEVSGFDDANWWRGRSLVSGKEGLFPASFVEEEKTERRRKSSKSKKSGDKSKSDDIHHHAHHHAHHDANSAMNHAHNANSATSSSDAASASSPASAATAGNAASTATAASAATAATVAAPRVDEEKLNLALHLIQQMDPGNEKYDADDQKLKDLELECASMSPLIDLELETTDRQHLQLMQLNQKLADAMQMYHFLMMSESAKLDSPISR